MRSCPYNAYPSIVGEVVNRPGQGAVIGAAIGITSGVIQLRYLLQVDDPKAQRAVRRYEKNLKNGKPDSPAA